MLVLVEQSSNTHALLQHGRDLSEQIDTDEKTNLLRLSVCWQRIRIVTAIIGHVVSSLVEASYPQCHRSASENSPVEFRSLCQDKPSERIMNDLKMEAGEDRLVLTSWWWW